MADDIDALVEVARKAARERGLRQSYVDDDDLRHILLAVRPLIEAGEREACAKRIEALGAQNSGRYAAAIRSRSPEQSGR